MLVIVIDYYNYFGGHKPEVKNFSNLVEGFKEYKRIKSNDFDYDDAFHHTKCYIRNDFTKEIPKQRPHARSYAEWLKKKKHERFKNDKEIINFLDKEMVEFLLSLSEDEDEIII